MLRKNFLFVILLFVGGFASAQNIKSQVTFRMLKTATSLMEAQQFEAAEEYFKKGLSRANANYDYYCQAFANEGLGNLYTKLEQPTLAIDHYKSAIRLYRAQKLTVIANVVETLLKSVQGIGDLYAGIEVGAKGIKLSVIDVKLSKDRDYDYTLKADTAINTDAAALSYQSEKETQDAISLLLDIVKSRYQIPSDKVHIVIASGLKQ
ncbi:MAG TPA: tetratricopeptide repeat protein, partial [Ferruginibacter sp.]|nr:tetratricopeptide repeat protein [Ferruginibacter sp.]